MSHHHKKKDCKKRRAYKTKFVFYYILCDGMWKENFIEIILEAER